MFIICLLYNKFRKNVKNDILCKVCLLISLKNRFEIDNKVRDEYIYLQIVSLLTNN